MILLMGDIHGHPGAIADAVERSGQTITAVVQLGDFGLKRAECNRLAGDVPVYWIDGNHEYYADFAPLQSAETPVPWAENCYYVPRGVVLEVGGRRFLCLGGADSVDYQYRPTHEAERITPQQLVRALQATGPFDAILTHTPPESVIRRHFPGSGLAMFGLPATWISPAACAIEVLHNAHPDVPIRCGHMHRSITDGATRILDIGEWVLIPTKEV